MNQDQLVQNAHLTAFGKLVDFAGDEPKYRRAVAVANIKIGDWETEFPWDSLYEPRRLVGVASSTDTYDLDDDIRTVSGTEGDYVEVRRLDGGVTRYETVSPDQLKRYKYGNYCAKVGRQLIFSNAFTNESQEFGGSIYAPVYRYAERLTAPNSEVPVDDPNWLVKITAAELSRTDTVAQNQYPNLVNEANALMVAMKSANSAQVGDITTGWRPGGADW